MVSCCYHYQVFLGSPTNLTPFNSRSMTYVKVRLPTVFSYIYLGSFQKSVGLGSLDVRVRARVGGM